jgi:hypothetical protein
VQPTVCPGNVGDPQSQRQRFRFAGIKVLVFGKVAKGRISLRVRLRGNSIRKHFRLRIKGYLRQEPLRSTEFRVVKRFSRLVKRRGTTVRWSGNVVGRRGVCLTPDGGIWDFGVRFMWRSGGKVKKTQAFMFFPIRPTIPPTIPPQPVSSSPRR